MIIGLGILFACAVGAFALAVHLHQRAIRDDRRSQELARLNQELVFDRLTIEADLLDLREELPPWVDMTTEEAPRLRQDYSVVN